MTISDAASGERAPREASEPLRTLGLGEAARFVSLSTATVYRLRREGRFPLPIRIGRRRIAWLVNDLEDWLSARPRVDLSAASAE